MKRGLYALGLLCVFLFTYSVSFAQPTANFSFNVGSGCSPILVQFSDQSTGNPTSWSWNLGNGATSNLQNPSTTYITAGTYMVTLTATNSGGSTTDTNYITVYASPTVNFTGDSLLSCPPKTVSFTNNSVAGVAGTATYTWDFGDGNTSSATSPSHTYTSTGNYNVSLIVTNSNGCTKTLTKNAYVKVDTVPTANFTVANGSSCTIPVTATFTNTTIGGATSYAWDFGDGSTSTATNPSHTYTTAGSYNVRLIATNSNGCKDTIIKSAAVSAGTLSAGFTKSQSFACSNQVINFTNTTVPGPGTSIWNYGDGSALDTVTNGDHSYYAAGTYTVTLVVLYNNCSDTTTQTVTVYLSPTAHFASGDTLGCSVPFSAAFTNNSSNATSYSWSFGDGGTSTATSPTHSYTALGTYNVKLVAINSNGCKDSNTKTAYVKLKDPASTITSDSTTGCSNKPINFTANIDSLFSATGYTWNFGDGSSSVTCSSCSTQSHTYTSTGTYTVTLIYTTSTGCTDTIQKSITVNNAPTAAFVASDTSVCPNTVVTFTNNSTNATTYHWYYGDGSDGTTTTGSYHYPNPGTWSVTLIASNSGCSDTLVKPNYITVDSPKAFFTYGYSCTNRLTYTFNDQSLGADTYSWNFGDGNTSTTAGSVTHTYATTGTYTITQTVSNNTSGCTTSFSRILTITSLDAQFSASDTTICKNNTVLFDAVETSNLYNYTWNYGDGSAVYTSIKDTVSHKYTNAGVYPVTLVVTEYLGCKDTLTKTAYIRVGGPSVNFVASDSNGCSPFNVTFTDNSTNGNAFGIANRYWTFGDGTNTNSSSNTVNHTYNTAGTYVVSLTVTDSNNCTGNLVKNNYIQVNNITANFTVSDTVSCPGVAVTFTNASSGANINSFLWNFGDGSTSTASNPTHIYTTSGSYTVTLIANSSGGCSDTIVKTSYVDITPPVVSFGQSDTFATCPPATIYFYDSSSSDITSWAWTFGNNNSSTNQNPSVVYTYPGVYTVKLIATTAAGCKDSATQNITIDGPTGTFVYSPDSGCNPLTVSFSSVANNTSSYIWDFGNGVTQATTANNTTYTYTQTGSYVPKLILDNGASCLVPLEGPDTIAVDEVSADFSFPPTGLCRSDSIHFTDTVTSISAVTGYSWNFGDGSTSSSHNPTHIYTSSGTYTVTFIATNINGCKDTVIKSITISTPPSVTASASPTSLCQGGTTPSVLAATGASIYTWTPSSGLSCTNCSNPNALPTATTGYVVTGTDTNGCVDTATVTVTVNSNPTVSAGSNKVICVGNTIGLQATGATNYAWSPAGGLSCTNCSNPNAGPSATTNYTVIGTDGNGCKDTATVTVTVNTQPTVSAGGNQTICFGDSVQLIATGANSYTWTPTSTLSCSNCDTTMATPNTTTTYTVIGTAGNNCSDTATVTVNVNALPNVSAGNNQAICAGSSASLQATGASTYAWTPTGTLSCSNCAAPTATPTATTTYTVTGTDVNGCKDTGNITVTVNALPTVSAGSNQTICVGFGATLQATGASSYAWTPATGLSCTNCSNPTATPTATTTYTVTGTDANGCTDTGVVTVNVNPQPILTTSSNITICIGTSTSISASGASTYAWSPSTGLSCSNCATPTASPSSTTTYTVVGTDANGCKDTGTVTVTVSSQPNVSAGNNMSICSGSSTTLTATGANSYTWSPSTGLSCTGCTSPTASPTTTTTYTVIGTSGNSCTDTATVTVTVNALPTISAGNDQSICAGAGASLQATGGSSYTWSPATSLSCSNCSNPTATPASTTTYTVTGTDANGCQNTDQITVTVNTLPTVSAGNDDTICNGSSTSLQATGANTYTWTPTTSLSCSNCSNPTATPTSTTTYIVTGTATNTCVDTDTVVVVVNPLPTITANNPSMCINDSAQLVATGAVSYAWTPTTGLSCSNCNNPIAKPSTTTTYTVTGTDANGCQNTAQATVTVNALPIVSASPRLDTLCAGDSIQVQATGATSYSWGPLVGLSCNNCANPMITPPATYTYIVTGTDANGCRDTAAITLFAWPKPNVNAGNDKDICIGESDSLMATGASTYSWSPSSTLSCNTCPDPIATPNTTTTYTVTGTDSIGCINNDKVTVTVHNPPAISAGANQTLCDGDSIQLSATGGTSYTWSPTNTLTCAICPDPLAFPTNTTTYKVVGTDQYGCTDSASVSVQVIKKQQTSVSDDDTLCIGESTTLLATGGDTYSWSPATGLSNPNIANPTAQPSITTLYRVLINQGNCFTDTAFVKVNVFDIPDLDLGPDQNVNAGDKVQLDAKSKYATKFAWSPATYLNCDDCSSPIAEPGKTITYTVVATTDNGCTATDDITLFVTCGDNQIFMANTFTPNGDGLNDRFYVQGKGISTVKRFTIYTRWGEIVYDSPNASINDPSKGWDGTYKGQPVKPDVFVYIVNAECESGTPIQIKGDISLVR